MRLLGIGTGNVAGQYTFASDPAAGAIGTYDLDILLPQFATIRRCVAVATQAFVGPQSFISFGTREVGVAAPVTDTTNLFVANAVAFYNTVDAQGNFQALASDTDFNANPLKLYTARTVVMAISGAALTAGAIMVYIEYSVMTF